MVQYDELQDSVFTVYGYKSEFCDGAYKWRVYDKRVECASIVARGESVPLSAVAEWFPAAVATVRVPGVWLALIKGHIEKLLGCGKVPCIVLPDFSVFPLQVDDSATLHVPATEEELIAACWDVLQHEAVKG